MSKHSRKSINKKYRVIPSENSQVIKYLSNFIGGPAGKHADFNGNKFFTPWNIILFSTISFFVLAWIAKVPCIKTTESNGKCLLNWNNDRQFWQLCYSKILENPPREFSDIFENGFNFNWILGVVFFTVFTFAKFLSTFLTRFGGDPILPEIIYFHLISLLFLISWVLVVYLIFRKLENNPWQVIWLGISPLVFFQGFIGYEIFYVLLLVACFYFFDEGKYSISGIFGGLFVVNYPIFILALVFFGFFYAKNKKRFNIFWIVETVLIITFGVLIGGKVWLNDFRKNISPNITVDSIFGANKGLFLADSELFKELDTNNLIYLAYALLVLVVFILLILYFKNSRFKYRLDVFLLLFLTFFSIFSFEWPVRNYLFILPFLVLVLPRIDIFLGWMIFVSIVGVIKMYSVVNSSNMGLPAQWFYSFYLVNGFVLLITVIYGIKKISKV